MSADRWITPGWVQGALNALREALDVDGAQKRDMIEFLFAEGLWDSEKLKWDAAVTKFNACLNPEKIERFTLVEIWALCKRFQRPQLLYAMLDDMGYEIPRRRASDERHQAALERLAAALERNSDLQAQALAELRMNGKEGWPVRIHPAVATSAARASFCRTGSEDGRPGGVSI